MFSEICSNLTLFKKSLLYKKDHKEWLFHPRRASWENRLFEGAEVKKVKQWGRGARKSYWVNSCPEKRISQEEEEVRFWNSAGVFSDCMHCPYCLEIIYKEARRAGHMVKTYPQQVVCGAVIFRKLLRNRGKSENIQSTASNPDTRSEEP